MKARQAIKWIALGMILANLLLGAWSWSVRPESRTPAEPRASALDQVILLRELTSEAQSRLALSLQTEQARDRVLQNVREIELPPESLPEAGCYVYSFPNQERLPVFLSRVQAVAANAYIGESATQQPGAIMLYIPPQPSFRLAEIELSELQAAGVDGFIIPDGDLANGVSVGVFNSEENIQQRVNQLQGFGHRLERYQYMVDRTVYAVNLPVLSQARIDARVWAEIRQDFPQMSSQQNSCWKVASTLNFN